MTSLVNIQDKGFYTSNLALGANKKQPPEITRTDRKFRKA